MSTIGLEQITGSDTDLKAALTDARLPTDDIEDDGRTFFKALSSDGQIVGFSGVERCDGDYLLRSVVVHPDRRGTAAGGVWCWRCASDLETPPQLTPASTAAGPTRSQPPSATMVCPVM